MSARTLISVALGLAAASCALRAAAPPPPPPAAAPRPEPPPDPISPIRADVEAQLTEQGERLWRSWLGSAESAPSPAPAAGAAAGPSASSTPAALEVVREAAAQASGDEQRALALLRDFLVGERLARDAGAAAERLRGARAQATVTWDGHEVAVSRVAALLAAEPDAERRAALEQAQARAAASWEPAAAEYRRALAASARALGRADLRELAAELRGSTPAALAARAEEVLESTGAAYRSLLDDLARRELSTPLARLRGADLPRLFALAQDARAFPAGKGAERALATLRELGFDLAARPEVVLDLGPRPGKEARPLLLAVNVPSAVRVSAAPLGGVSEERALLRALGGAAYFSSVKATQLEFRRFGGVIADAWSGAFEELAGDPEWLVRHTGLGAHALDPTVRAAAALRLHGAREAAARLLLELGRAPGAAPAPEAVKALCERAFARPVEASEAALFAAEADPLLRAADTLAARLLAAQAESHLVRLAGRAWWRSEKAGAFLRGAFADGSRPTPELLARSLGFERLDAGALVAVTRARADQAGGR